MKQTLIICLLTATVSVFAGPPAYNSPMPMNPAPMTQELLFGPGFHMGVHGLFLTPDSDRKDDTFGGGFNLDYFFTPIVGMQASASWADPGTDEIWHNYTLDLVLRAPIEVAYIAPYVLGGGGVILEDSSELLGRVGVGLEFRPSSNFGIFTDWIYSFPGGGGGEDDNEDYQMVRAGIKFGF